MKRLLVITLAFCLVVCSASADFNEDIIREYYPFSKAMGAPAPTKLDVSVRDAAKNSYTIQAGDITLVMELTASGAISTVLVCAGDDSCAADFLCSCMAMIYYLGGYDLSAFGQVLNGFAFIRTGSVMPLCSIGADSFAIMSVDPYKYVFSYTNADLKTSD